MKTTILTVAAATLLAIPTSIIAQDKPAGDKPAPGAAPGGPGGPGGRRGGGTPEEQIKRMTEQLGLSQEQQDKIKAIYAKNADAMKAAREKGFDKLTEEERTKMGETMKAQRDEINAVLTPEQKEKAEKARAERGRGGPGGPGGRPGGDKPAGGKPEEKKPDAPK